MLLPVLRERGVAVVDGDEHELDGVPGARQPRCAGGAAGAASAGSANVGAFSGAGCTSQKSALVRRFSCAGLTASTRPTGAPASRGLSLQAPTTSTRLVIRIGSRSMR